jgi:hypothetical protein
MWRFAFVPMFMVLYDFAKLPVDRLYFTNPWRPLLGIQNTFRDVINGFRPHEVKNYPGLLLISLHYRKIREEFERVSPKLKKTWYHETNPWFEKNEGYYFYKAEDFPLLKSLINQIPCVHTEGASFAVIEGPMVLAPHRAESNELLRYQLTIEGGGDCTLYTESGNFIQREGEDFLFDHGRYHELMKTGPNRRVLLILDVHR